MNARDQMQLDLCGLQSLFDCVNRQAKTMIGDGDIDIMHYGLVLECIAEKGIREADDAMRRLHKPGKKKTAAAFVTTEEGAA